VRPVVKPKWRPPLGAVIFVVLATVLALPLVGLFFFRLYENQLVRQTEAELIAQGAAVAAVFAQEILALPERGSLLGAAVPAPAELQDQPYRPIEPSLDLTSEDRLGRRPNALPSAQSVAPAYMLVGEKLAPVILATQDVTLAGFRLLDPRGRVIAGREEVGLSLAHVEEVASALDGRYRSVMRARISDQPTPPLYSISRGTGVRVFVAMPVVVDDRVAGVVYASRTPSNIIKHIYSERGKFLLAALAVLGVALAIGILFSRVITRPIHALVARAAEIGQGRRDAITPIAHHGTREIALLSQSFLDMADKLAERSNYIATFAAHVSHELKTPLTSIQGAAELLRDDVVAAASTMTAEEHRRFLDNIVADTQRLTVMLHRLRELARADNPATEGSTTLGSIAEDLRRRFPDLHIKAEGDLERPLAMSAENAAIIFGHLADNAGNHGARHISLAGRAKDDLLEIVVQDDGEGVSIKNRDRIFETFFTTRRERGGTGMGLGIVEAMLRAHSGWIHLGTSESGTVFHLKIRTA
jgi:signal transduction histidine kinase